MWIVYNPGMYMRDSYKRSIYLILIMACMTMIVLGTTTYILYHVAFAEERQRLVETAQSQARLMEAIAHHRHGQRGGSVLEDVLQQVREAHEQFVGFGETGEFTLARLEGDQIVFLLSHRHHDLENVQPVAMDSEEAEPMRLALQGKSGSIVGLDYRGETVLAAYEPVADLHLGIVAKIDLKEVQAPFFFAAWVAAGIALLLIFVGAWGFQRITKPILATI